MTFLHRELAYKDADFLGRSMFHASMHHFLALMQYDDQPLD